MKTQLVIVLNSIQIQLCIEIEKCFLPHCHWIRRYDPATSKKLKIIVNSNCGGVWHHKVLQTICIKLSKIMHKLQNIITSVKEQLINKWELEKLYFTTWNLYYTYIWSPRLHYPSNSDRLFNSILTPGIFCTTSCNFASLFAPDVSFFRRGKLWRCFCKVVTNSGKIIVSKYQSSLIWITQRDIAPEQTIYIYMSARKAVIFMKLSSDMSTREKLKKTVTSSHPMAIQFQSLLAHFEFLSIWKTIYDGKTVEFGPGWRIHLTCLARRWTMQHLPDAWFHS